MASSITSSTYFKTILALIIPAVLAFFVLGGGASAPGLGIHLSLQMLGLVILLGCLWVKGSFSIPGAARPFLAIAGAWICLVLLQLVPLPGVMRQVLPGGGDIVRGFTLIGVDTPSLPLSLTPGQTLAGLFMIIPPLAIFLLALRMSWKNLTTWLLWGISGLAVLSVMLGLMQVSAGRDSTAYLYEITNRGAPVGLFSNINHQAMFLLMALPFVGAMLGRQRTAWSSGDRDPGPLLFMVILALIISAGVLFAGSLAGYALLLPTLFLSLTLVIGRRKIAGLRWRYIVPAVFVVGVIGTAFGIQPLFEALGIDSTLGGDDSGLSRGAIWSTSARVAGDYWFVGAGLGAFPEVYPIYDDTINLTAVYANHAHNDYLEWVIEFGVLGVALLIAFLIFAVRETIRVWTMQGGNEVRIKRAASIALWLPFLHSFVDYPLRTPAIASLVAVSLAIMISPADRVRRTRKEKKDEPSKRMSKQVEI